MYTPSTINKIIKEKVNKMVDLKPLITVTGTYVNRRNPPYPSKEYESVYYDKLKDPKTNDSVTLIVPQDKKTFLKDGKEYELNCLVKYTASNEGTVKFSLIAETVLNETAEIDYRQQEVIDAQTKILKIFHDKPRENPSSSLKRKIKVGEQPKIALVQPENNKTLDDIKEGAGEFWNKYNVKKFPVNIHKSSEVITELLEIDHESDFDLILIFRGGGSDEEFDVFESIELAEVIINLQTPLVTAIGHARDEPFIQRISNRSFITPTDFGNYLKETYINSGKEDDLTQWEKRIKTDRTNLETRQDELQEKQLQLSEFSKNLTKNDFSNKKETEKLSSERVEIENKTQQNIEDAIQNEKVKDRNIKIMIFGVLLIIAGITTLGNNILGSPRFY